MAEKDEKKEEKKDAGGHGGGAKKKGPNWGMPFFILIALVLIAVGLSQFGEIIWASRTAIEGSFNLIVRIMMMFVPPIIIAILVFAVLKAINKKEEHH